MSGKYETTDIFEMGQVEHLRSNLGMYIGSTESPTRLIEELLDNSLDEVQSGHCNIIGIFVDTKNKVYRVLDNGRGIPFDKNLPLEEDPPILASTKLFTSGKFKKGKDKSAYKIASGLHGIGNVAVYALSEFMEIEVYRNNQHALYMLKSHETENGITRDVKEFKEQRPFSTKVTFKPSSKYFSKLDIYINQIEERLRIAVANYPDLKVVLRIDDKDHIIKGSEQDLILDYLTEDESTEWIEIRNKKGIEECYLKLAWDNNPPATQKVLSCVNLVRVHSGVHINKLYNILRNVFSDLAKKHKYTFGPNDCLSFIRVYVNLKIIRTSFEAQVKVRLESKSDLSVMDGLENKLKTYLDKNPEFRNNLLNKFEEYRKSLHARGLKVGGSKRVSGKFTKLSDCTGQMGELFIGEGESAVGGLIQCRDSRKHAILPLKGVIANAITKKDLLKNEEIKDIVNAIGTGIEPNFDINKLRYSKILLAADADPAGKFITTLLIVLFAKLTPELIKHGKVYVVETPLFGTRKNKKFIPLWTQDDINIAKSEGSHITRQKGLGEFLPKDLKIFTLDEDTRKIHKITWSENYEKLFKLMSSSSEKRKLAMGQWRI